MTQDIFSLGIVLIMGAFSYGLISLFKRGA